MRLYEGISEDRSHLCFSTSISIRCVHFRVLAPLPHGHYLRSLGLPNLSERWISYISWPSSMLSISKTQEWSKFWSATTWFSSKAPHLLVFWNSYDVSRASGKVLTNLIRREHDFHYWVIYSEDFVQDMAWQWSASPITLRDIYGVTDYSK